MKKELMSMTLGAMIGLTAGIGHWMATEKDAVTTPALEPIVAQAAEQEGLAPMERELLAAIVYAEANTEDLIGKRLVIDTIMNRVNDPRFPDTIWGVIYQPYQYWTAGMPYDTSIIPAECYEAVDADPIDNEILYFRTGYYHSFGTPVVRYGAHYFSK